MQIGKKNFEKFESESKSSKFGDRKTIHEDIKHLPSSYL